MKQPAPTKLEAILGHRFADQRLLTQALTHSSLAYEKNSSRNSEKPPEPSTEEPAPAADPHNAPDDADNEQLEFLGDAVLGLLAAEDLYRRFPGLSEGELTRLRANLVSRRHLGLVAAKLELGEHLRLGRGEERSGGRTKAALLANGMEAVLGALYLDAGLAKARAFVEKEIILPYVDELRQQLDVAGTIGDHKSALQEHLQARHLGTPEYVTRGESGPDHRKRFLVEVRVAAAGDGQRAAVARGIGSTKKKAEQEAARRALARLLADGRRPASALQEDDPL